MRILDYLQYSMSTTVRCVACAILGGALLFLYRWDPERRADSRRDDQGSLEEIPVDPPCDTSALRALGGNGAGQTKTAGENHPTLQELKRYLSDLRRNRIRSMDNV